MPVALSPHRWGITISTLGGRVATYQINRHVPIKFGSLIIKTTLLILGLDSVDIILGTDWLTRHQAVIDIAARVSHPGFRGPKPGREHKHQVCWDQVSHI